jgi:hypothetical protein
MSRVTTLENLPLFADDKIIGIALLGAARAREWIGIVSLLEAQGFPKIDPIFGGRYTPAIRKYLDVRAGVENAIIPVREGREDFSEWHNRKGQRRA